MTDWLADFAKGVKQDTEKAAQLCKAIDFLELCAGDGSIEYIEIHWAAYLRDQRSSEIWPAEKLILEHLQAAWSDIHKSILARAKEDLAAIERRYEPLRSGS